MSWEAAAASVIGSLLSSEASSSASAEASAAQERATQAAIAERRRQYDQTRSDLAPYRDTGSAANKSLAYYLGLGGGGGDTSAIRERLLPQYTRNTTVRGDPYLEPVRNDGDFFAGGGIAYGPDKTTSTVDEESLQAAIDREVGAPNDPVYGSLLKNFTGDDVASEPGYQFGLSEGEKGINRATAARGGYDSGATLKALARYNQDYAGTKYGEAYNRDASNKNRIYGFLSGTSAAGQNAAAQTATAGNDAAAGISSALMANGNNQSNLIMGNAANQNAAIQGGIGNFLYSQRTQPKNSAIAGSTSSYGGGINWDNV